MTVTHRDPEYYRDLAGKPIEIDDPVITTESNRIVTGRVKKINKTTGNITVEPMMSSTGNRRRPPIQRNLTRAPYNVYVIPQGDELFTQIRGYWHNDGDHKIRRPKKLTKTTTDDDRFPNF